MTLGDKLVSIDGVGVRGVSAGELSGVILGTPGSKVAALPFLACRITGVPRSQEKKPV